MYADEAFSILEPYLPLATRMTSAYRSPQDQVSTIRNLARRYNVEQRRHPIPLPEDMTADRAEMWLSTLRRLRDLGYVVNAPVSGHATPVSPHATYNIAFDLSGANLDQIVTGCRRAQERGLIGFGQILKIPVNNVVHVQVNWISSRALENLHARIGFAIA